MSTLSKSHIFADVEINKGRQRELDVAKAVLLFFLVFIHCTIECTPDEQLSFGIPYLFGTVIGGPFSAPMYMFAMGVGMVYSRRTKPGDYVRRGVRITYIGFALNICRFVIPFLIGFLITGDYNQYIDTLPYRLFGNDILQFASLAMLIIGLLTCLHIPDVAMLLLCFGMSLLGTCLNGFDAGNSLGNIFLGYLIGTEDAAGMVLSDFPVLNWLLFPVSGYIFGRRLLHVRDKTRFYMSISPICLLITAVYFTVGIHNGSGMFGEGQNCYYHLETPDAIACLTLTVGMLGIYHWLTRHLPDRISGVIADISRNINVIYCVHWVLVTVSINLILFVVNGTQVLPVSAVMLISLCISVFAILISHFWSSKLKPMIIRRNNKLIP